MDSFEFEMVETNVGFSGGSMFLTVKYYSTADMWFFWHSDVHGWLDVKNRYWIPYGLGKPQKNTPIKVEVNVPYELNRRVAGVYITDESGNCIIGHRGVIGGGRPGVGKSLFFEHYNGEIKIVDDVGRSTQIAIISNIEDENLLQNLRNFVSEIDRIKNMR